MIIKLLKIIIRKLSAVITLLKLLSFVALSFCVWMCVHYYFQHYPDAEIASKPMDYFGMTVGFFTIMVTLLIGWNIHGTIKAKDELCEARDKMKKQYRADIVKLKTDVERLKAEQKKQATKETKEAAKTADAMREISEQNVNLAAILNSRAYETAQRDILIHGTKLYNWLFKIIDESMSVDDIYSKYLEVKEKHPEKVSFINGMDATRNEVLETINMVRPIKLLIQRIANKDKTTPRKNETTSQNHPLTPPTMSEAKEK